MLVLGPLYWHLFGHWQDKWTFTMACQLETVHIHICTMTYAILPATCSSIFDDLGFVGVRSEVRTRKHTHKDWTPPDRCRMIWISPENSVYSVLMDLVAWNYATRGWDYQDQEGMTEKVHHNRFMEETCCFG